METTNKILRINIVYPLQRKKFVAYLNKYTHAIIKYKFIFCLWVNFSIRNNNS